MHHPLRGRLILLQFKKNTRLVELFGILLNPPQVIIRLGTSVQGLVTGVVRHCRHDHTGVGRVNPVFVEGHGVQKGVMGAESPRIQFCGVKGPEGCQRAIRTILKKSLDFL